MGNFKELLVYKKSFSLAMEVFELSKKIPKEENGEKEENVTQNKWREWKKKHDDLELLYKKECLARESLEKQNLFIEDFLKTKIHSMSYILCSYLIRFIIIYFIKINRFRANFDWNARC